MLANTASSVCLSGHVELPAALIYRQANKTQVRAVENTSDSFARVFVPRRLSGSVTYFLASILLHLLLCRLLLRFYWGSHDACRRLLHRSGPHLNERMGNGVSTTAGQAVSFSQ